MPVVVRKAEELKGFDGGAFVPTMGALHEGHLALIRRAASLRPVVVVSVFVNPTQFGPSEDFSRYPRQLERDVQLAGEAGAHVVFAPDVEVMYPPGVNVPVPALPAVATQPGLEDRIRPGHFAGVCQVVARLFDLVRPSAAVFGEKDYQQLLVIRSLVEQEKPRWGELEIVAHPTKREVDGLAMSSRNVYLSAEERGRATALFRALASAKECRTPKEAETRMANVLRESGLEIDYAVVRDADTLLPVSSAAKPARAVIAARLGNVRLIDNDAITFER